MASRQERMKVWAEQFVGKYIKVHGVKQRILEVGDYEPSDRSVGIWHGFLQVRTKTGWYDCVTNGSVDRVDENGNETNNVGTHNLKLE